MAERAQVTSVEAIDSFRASLILYLSKARPVLDEVCHEVLRTQLWLQNDQRAHWERELRLRRKKLEQAQAELFSAMLSKIQKVTAAHQMAVHRAERDVKEVEAKQALLKQWDRELENRSQPLLKQVESLQSFLTTEMARAVAYLTQILKALEDYAGTIPPAAATGPPPPNPQDTPLPS